MDFVILDTEGKPNLTELAIVDSQGVVIYEAALTFVTNHQEWYHWIFTKFGFTPPKK